MKAVLSVLVLMVGLLAAAWSVSGCLGGPGVEPPLSSKTGGEGATGVDDGLPGPTGDMNTMAGQGGSGGFGESDQPAAPTAGGQTGAAGAEGYKPGTDMMDGGVSDGAIDTGLISPDGGEAEDDAGQDFWELAK